MTTNSTTNLQDIVYLSSIENDIEPSRKRLRTDDETLNIIADDLISEEIPFLDTSKITTGVFNIMRIPDLDASKTTTGVFYHPRIPDLDASKTTTGVFDPARIPDLDASKTTTGVFDPARIPDFFNGGTYSQILLPFIRYPSSYQYEFHSSMTKENISHIGSMTITYAFTFANEPPEALRLGGMFACKQHCYRQSLSETAANTSSRYTDHTISYTINPAESFFHSFIFTHVLSDETSSSGLNIPVMSVSDATLSFTVNYTNTAPQKMTNTDQTTFHCAITLNMDSSPSFDTVFSSLNITHTST